MKLFRKRAMALLCVAVLLLTTIPFTAAVSAASQYVFLEDFQSYESGDVPAGWKIFNTDGDEYCWEIDREYYGNVSYVSTSALSGKTLNTDECLVTPAIHVPDKVEANYFLSFDMRNTCPWARDQIMVYASATPVTDPLLLSDEQLLINEKYYGGDVEMQTLTADLTAYRGQTVYFAFRHVATDSWQFEIDNVAVVSEEADRFDVEFTADNSVVSVMPVDGTYEVIDGQDYAFTVAVDSAYRSENGMVTVVANDKEILPSGGVYTLKNVTEDQEVEVAFAYAAGDTNGDGTVTIHDAVQIYYAVLGAATLNPVALAAGNVDTYPVFNIKDAMIVYYYVSGLRSYVNVNTDPSLLWKNEFMDLQNGFQSAAVVQSSAYYLDRTKVTDYAVSSASRDGKCIFYRNGNARIANLSDGYVFTLPFDDFRADYSLSALRSRYESDSFVLNVSKESSNPYGNNAGSWNTYLTEWLNRYIANDSFLARNDLSRTHASATSTTLIPGYTVMTYDIVIDDAQDVAMPYYNIAIIRKSTEYVKFHLFVMKSTSNQHAAMQTVIKSFKEFTAVGQSKNEEVAFECEPNKNWNEETAAYYQKLLEQDSTDWGFFTESMTDDYSSSSRDRLAEEYAELSGRLNYEYEIMPTYTHIGWGSQLHYFPSKMANEFAGGNGFNGKPVLQFTYQFTTSNNTNLNDYTPMFDVARGEYDDHFRQLARDIKSYGKPVLFRLNNEMNTDWTSYCGIVNLLDPDLFAITWERLYSIFEAEGVDNCIWIFNPFSKSTPYCSWGEDLCYLPDIDTVHVLGLTAYEMGNESTLASFKTLYSDLYEKNSPYFNNYPAVISEFGAGAGGEKKYNWGAGKYVDTVLGRNADKQEAWVKAMFECFEKRNQPGYEFCKNIKGAVWFAVNDYAAINDVNYITNFFELNDKVSGTVNAFKEGLAVHP